MLRILMASNFLTIALTITLLAVIFCAIFLFRFQEKTYKREISRLSVERDKLQDELFRRNEHDT